MNRGADAKQEPMPITVLIMPHPVASPNDITAEDNFDIDFQLWVEEMHSADRKAALTERFCRSLNKIGYQPLPSIAFPALFPQSVYVAPS